MLPIRNRSEPQTLSVRSPAKLIISGEHSVLYGQPALAVAIDRYTTTTVSYSELPQIHFKLANLSCQQSHSSKDLQVLARNLRRDYANYLDGHANIATVLKRPFELLQYSVSNILEYLNAPLTYGLEISVDSSIPIGCGMGSSAAAIIATIFALSNFFKFNWQHNKHLSIAREIENLQHGKSSGLDLHLVMHGGYVRFQSANVIARPVPSMSLQIINTGQPLSSTGQCVSKVAERFVNDAKLAENFGNVTNILDVAISTNNLQDLKRGIRLNHQLLNYIGVVPTKVANLINAIEVAGGAAKICGAGATMGDNAGMVLLVSDHDMQDLVQSHGYQLQNIQVDTHGTQII